jgi:hypothetical protein
VEGGHEAFYLRLEQNLRQVEDRPVPSQVHQVQWAGGRGPFRWRDVPRLVLDLKRVIREVRPDLVHAGPIQTCAFLAVLTGFQPILTMSWGFDLMEDVHRSGWWEWVARYTLARSAFTRRECHAREGHRIRHGRDYGGLPGGVDLNNSP